MNCLTATATVGVRLTVVAWDFMDEGGQESVALPQQFMRVTSRASSVLHRPRSLKICSVTLRLWLTAQRMTYPSSS
jgi:hypothetical protein